MVCSLQRTASHAAALAPPTSYLTVPWGTALAGVVSGRTTILQRTTQQQPRRPTDNELVDDGTTQGLRIKECSLAPTATLTLIAQQTTAASLTANLTRSALVVVTMAFPTSISRCLPSIRTCFLTFFMLATRLLALVPSTCSTDPLSVIELIVDFDRISALGMSDVFQAYQLVQPNVTFSTRVQTSQPSIADVAADAVDFAMLSTGLTSAQAVLYPQLQTFPAMCSAVVPIYRLDALSGALLVLSRPALAAIYAGHVTWWNDSAIQSTNTATLPSLPIRVVYQGELSAVSTMFVTALAKFYLGFPIAASSTPIWPLGSYAAYGSGTGQTGVSAAVLTVDGSVGYAPQSNALAAGVDVAHMINWANQTVSPTSASITAAVTEVASGYSQIKRQTAQLDYTDGHGAQAWPIPILVSMLLDLTTSRSTCHQRAAVVDFWTWYYTSSVPAALLAQRQYATIPAFLQSQLDPVTALQTTVMCRGSPAFTTTSASVRLLGTSSGTQFVANLLSQAYMSVDNSVSWQPQVGSDELVMDQVYNAEVDIGFFIPGQLTEDTRYNRGNRV